ncbi:hypothetical protein [Floridanema aerugineum]|uniref:Uncharacterized protein n=1 Tax=Floridaenema aerugineum BLCC-F46 TaxID=3153654 RepID=A0ABV4X609_9CYAN
MGNTGAYRLENEGSDVDRRGIYLPPADLHWSLYGVPEQLSQFKKMEQDLRNQGEIRSKHAMHLIRLLLSGITILEAGFVPVQVEE